MLLNKITRIIKISIISILTILCINISGCILKPYVADVQQGNILESSRLSQLHNGMSKEEVVSLLGTPILNIFSDDDWTYVHTNQINGGKMNEKSVELKFLNNKVIGIKINGTQNQQH